MKSIKYYLLILIISIIPLYSLYTTDRLIHTHDGLVHLARIGAYYKALGDLQFPVRWAGDLNYGYGMPLFNFMYQVPYFVSSVFLFLGFGLVNSFKLTLALSYVLSGVFIFAFGKTFFNNTKKAFLVTIFYQFSTFRFVEVLVRGSFGEIYTYTFFPLALLGLVLLFKRIKFVNILITVLAIALLILSHNALSLVFFFIVLLFVLFFAKTKKNFFWGMFSVISGWLLSAFYWMPAILEHKYTYGDLFMKDIYLKHFPPLQKFFIPNFANNPSLQIEKIAVQIGFFHEIAILISILLILISLKKLKFINKVLVNNKQITNLSKIVKGCWTSQHDDNKKLIFFSLILIFVALFFMQPVSQVFWQKISLLRQFQFPWRLLALISFASSLLSVTILNFKIFKNNLVYVLVIFLLIFSTVAYWKPQEGYDKIDEKYYWNYPLNTTYYGETDLIWSAGMPGKYPKNRVDVIGGKAEIKNFYKKSNLQTFIVDAKTPAQLVSHTQYFPGWKVYSNDKQIPIEFQDMNWRGELTFYLPAGINNVQIKFEESKVRIIADILSLLSIVILIALVFKRKMYET